MGLSGPAFKGHSRSSKVTQFDSDLCGPIMHRFRDKRRFWLKNVFFLPVVFNGPLRVLMLEFCNAVRAQKLKRCPYQVMKK